MHLHKHAYKEAFRVQNRNKVDEESKSSNIKSGLKAPVTKKLKDSWSLVSRQRNHCVPKMDTINTVDAVGNGVHYMKSLIKSSASECS